MKPTKEQLERILTTAVKLRKEEDKMYKALEALFKILSPSEYSPIIERNPMYGYMEAIKAVYGEKVYDDVEYFIYEVPLMRSKRVECIDKAGRKYDAKKLPEYIKFVMT